MRLSEHLLHIEGKELASSYNGKFIETSAGLKHNVDELLVGVLKQILLRVQDKDHDKPDTKVTVQSDTKITVKQSINFNIN